MAGVPVCLEYQQCHSALSTYPLLYLLHHRVYAQPVFQAPIVQHQPVQQEQYTAKEVVVEEEEQDEFDMDLTQNDFDTPVDTINTDDINMDGMDW